MVGIIVFIIFASADIQPWAGYHVDLADEEIENVSLIKTEKIENPLDEVR